jgi:hypothetical protein
MKRVFRYLGTSGFIRHSQVTLLQGTTSQPQHKLNQKTQSIPQNPAQCVHKVQQQSLIEPTHLHLNSQVTGCSGRNALLGYTHISIQSISFCTLTILPAQSYSPLPILPSPYSVPMKAVCPIYMPNLKERLPKHPKTSRAIKNRKSNSDWYHMQM